MAFSNVCLIHTLVSGRARWKNIGNTVGSFVVKEDTILNQNISAQCFEIRQ